MINVIKEKQTKLFLGCQYARLNIALDAVKKELSNNASLSIKETDPWYKKFATKTENFIKENVSNRLCSKKKKIEEQLDSFKRRNSYNSYAHNYAELDRLINELYRDDTYGMAKMVFSAGIVFDGEYDYKYYDIGLKNLSRLIWGDENTLIKVESDVKKIYEDLARQPLGSTQKWLLAGTAAIAMAIAVVPALTIGNVSAAGITGGLAGLGSSIGLGGTIVEGVGMIAIAELLLDSAIVGFAYKSMDMYNRNIVKKSFREMDYNRAAHMLAIKCYLMKRAKSIMPSNLYKEKISELLQMIQDLKSDTDYLLFVERELPEVNKNKIRVFHNMDKKLMEML